MTRSAVVFAFFLGVVAASAPDGPKCKDTGVDNVTMDTVGYACVEDGTWIGHERVCDGVSDCGEFGDDETFCLDSPQPSLCRDLSENAPVYTCLKTEHCLPHTYFCDNIVDCELTEEDELHCDQQYIPGCSYGVMQLTCINVTMNTSRVWTPNNIRFIALNGVQSSLGGALTTVESLIDLDQYPYVVKLYLIDNNLRHLHLGKPNRLPYLRSLHVSHNKLRAVRANSFLAAPNLLHLELPNNDIIYIESGAFRGMTSLTQLDIVGNKIQTLRVDTFNSLYSLRVINMSHNDLEDLEPGVFANLANVSYLGLSYNRMGILKKGTFNGLSKVSSLDIKRVPVRRIELGAFEGLTGLRSLELSGNALKFIHADTFRELSSLQHLVIMDNSLPTLQRNTFNGLRNVTTLNLVNDSISTIVPGAFSGLENLLFLDLANNTFTELQAGTFAGLTKLQVLWMRYVPLKHIDPGAFAGLSSVVSLNILHTDIEAPSLGILDGLENLKSLSTNDHRLCCLLDPARNISCNGPTKSFSTCQRLMPNALLRVAIWLLGISAVLGNLFVMGQRVVSKGRRELTVQSLLITNLAVSDFMMGVYMLALGAADMHFGGSYFLWAEAWRDGGWCKGIGFLSVLSSEASVFFVMLISIDRFVSIALPFSRFRLETRLARVTIAILWVIAFGLSLVATLMADINRSFYGLSDVCVGLPLITTPVNQSSAWTFSRDTGTFAHETSDTGFQPAWSFSVFLFLGLNLVCFTVVLVCYVLIFVIVRRSSRSVARRGATSKASNGAVRGTTSSTQRSVTFSREVKLATRMALVVGTDFLCWMPIVITGILTQSDLITVPEELYAWIVVFILPINSSLNPYLYTISEVISKQRKKTTMAKKCVRMTYTLPIRISDDRTLHSSLDSDTPAAIGRGL